MVKILITNATIVTFSKKHDLVINNGYIFINDGIIKAVGSGEIPEELQYPELLISGRGRLVIPGFSSGYTKVTTYPLRYLLTSLTKEKIYGYLSTLSRIDVYYSAILAFTDLLYKGITSLMVSDIYLDDIARAANDVGIPVVLASPINMDLHGYDPYHELKLIMQRWHGRVENIFGAVSIYGNLNEGISLDEFHGSKIFVIGADNLESLKGLNSDVVIAVDPLKEPPKELNAIRTYNTLYMWKAFQGFGIGDSITYDIFDMLGHLLRLGHNSLDLLFSATSVTSSIIGLNTMNCIEEGKKANIVIYNFTEPPAWPLLPYVEAIANAIVGGRLRVESVIVGDNILVDGGEILSVGVDLIKKATVRLEDMVKRSMK